MSRTFDGTEDAGEADWTWVGDRRERGVGRRSVLRAAGAAGTASLLPAGTAAVTGSAGVGTASAAEGSGYRFVSEAAVPNPTDVKIDGTWAFAATGDSISVVDVSNPRLPTLADRQPAENAFWEDLKLGGADGNIASLAQDADDPGGILLYDTSGPANLERGRLYRAGEGIHNHFIDDNRDVAYLCVSDPFTNPRVVIVDIGGGLSDTDTVDVPITREEAANDDTVLSIFRLSDVNPDMAAAGLNPCHDLFVEHREERGGRDVAHVCFWDAGVVSVDVTDPTDPVALAHFNAVEDADVEPRSTTEFYSRYIGMPGNSHYTRPTPDGEYLFVGAEAYPDPTGTAIPEEHGGIKVFDLSAVGLQSPLDPDSPRYDPQSPAPVERIAPPEEPEYGALRTSHNFDFSDDGSRFYSVWYQGGVRGYDTSDPTDITELASFLSPNGNAFWEAQALDLPDDDPDARYTVASDRNGKGLVVLELVDEETGPFGTPSATDVKDSRPELTDVFGGTMAQPFE